MLISNYDSLFIGWEIFFLTTPMALWFPNFYWMENKKRQPLYGFRFSDFPNKTNPMNDEMGAITFRFLLWKAVKSEQFFALES